jgi:hypothetical protein
VTQPTSISQGLRLLVFALVVLALVFIPLPAFSQGCALCYTQAAASGAKMIQALKNGIMILVVPPTLGSIGMIFLLHRKRHQIRRDDHGDRFGQDW